MSASPVEDLLGHLFRHQFGKIVSTLTRVFGPHNLELAEEVAQDALVKALQQWPFQGVPENPSAWLIQVAKNRALDLLRRDAGLRKKMPELLLAFDAGQPAGDKPQAFMDDQLSMMFLCCHPDIPSQARLCLTLKTVSGFSVGDIARALLANEPAIAQRLVRAKRQIRAGNKWMMSQATPPFPLRLSIWSNSISFRTGFFPCWPGKSRGCRWTEWAPHWDGACRPNRLRTWPRIGWRKWTATAWSAWR